MFYSNRVTTSSNIEGDKCIIISPSKNIGGCIPPRNVRLCFLYSKFNPLMLTEVIKIEFAKFMFKYTVITACYHVPSFHNHFTKLGIIHHHNTRLKVTSEFFQPFIASETGKKSLQHIGLKIWITFLKNLLV